MSTKDNWFQNPDKKKLIILTLLSFTGIFLCLLAMSNFFTESIFQGKYFMMWFLIVANIGVYIKFYSNYKKSQQK